jgi:hypothetical protein
VRQLLDAGDVSTLTSASRRVARGSAERYARCVTASAMRAAVACTLLAAAGCGGLLSADGDGSPSPAFVDAGSSGSQSAGEPDASPADAFACTCDETCVFTSLSPDDRDGAYLFKRREDILAFYDGLAALNSLDVPAHRLSCSPEAGLISCPYDPLEPRLDPSDVHYSDALQRFVGPEGDPWVWAYFADRGSWIAVNGTRNAVVYALLGQYNACHV